MYSIAMTPRLSSCSRTGGAGADRLAAFRPSRGPQRPTRAARQVFAKAVATPTKEASTSASKSASISSETAKELYRDMVLGREFEEMCAQMYYRGKMFGFVHLYSGQEAVSTGRAVGVSMRIEVGARPAIAAHLPGSTSLDLQV